MSQAELLRSVEESDARDTGIRFSATLFSAVLGIADEERFSVAEPARSQMIFEAEFFASSYTSYHARRFFPDEELRRKFVGSVNDNFALLAQVVTEHASPDAFRSDFESVLAIRQERYCKFRSNARFRLLRMFLGETFVDRIFLTYGIKARLSQSGLGEPESDIGWFIQTVVSETHTNLVKLLPTGVMRHSATPV